jgi:prepilin-type N-terminal cleavage/methylation domain-containing protein
MMKMQLKKEKINKGLSLVEVLFALAIMATVIASIMSLFPAILKLNDSGWDQIQMNYLAQQKMDQIIAGIETDPSNSDTTIIPTGGMRKWTVGSLTTNGSRPVEVKIIWLERKIQRTYILNCVMKPQ